MLARALNLNQYFAQELRILMSTGEKLVLKTTTNFLAGLEVKNQPNLT